MPKLSFEIRRLLTARFGATGGRRWPAALGTLVFFLWAHPDSLAQLASGSMERGDFRLNFDEYGIAGLSNPRDPFGAQMLVPGQHLGLIVRFRVGDTNWLEVPPRTMRLANDPNEGKLSYTNDVSESALAIKETFVI